jgi:benzoyl-CoA 2,3-dioxygenase component A
MNAPEQIVLIRQHLIDPEICIRCNTCEETCPVNAITHDDRNYVVNADVCNACGACISPCPTGAIDHWHTMPRAEAYSLAEQFGWDDLPAEKVIEQAVLDQLTSEHAAELAEEVVQVNAATSKSSTTPPWSAAHPYVNLYTTKAPIIATVAGNFRLTAAETESDIRHIVLDFGTQIFPILEGQSIGIIPPGVDRNGKPHYMRMYSVASPRNGEREGYNNLSLTVKRVVSDHEGKPVRGIGSNYLCDLQKGETVQVAGPFGASYLMPNHAGSNILMFCTGTGSAPMRAMTEYRRRLFLHGQSPQGKLMLFFGSRTPEELPYFGPLRKLPAELIDTHMAFSRMPDQPRAYVQDKMRQAGAAIADLLGGDTYVYVCGLKGMEAGVLEAMQEICSEHGMDWPALHGKMIREGRMQIETY